jgi:hypothetical protein
VEEKTTPLGRHRSAAPPSAVPSEAAPHPPRHTPPHRKHRRYADAVTEQQPEPNAEPHPAPRPAQKPARTRPTPVGTWPVIVAGALLLSITPITIAFVAFPKWLTMALAVIFAVAGIWALATSFVLLWRTHGTHAQGVPIIGCVLGSIVVTVTLALMVPMAFAG